LLISPLCIIILYQKHQTVKQKQGVFCALFALARGQARLRPDARSGLRTGKDSKTPRCRFGPNDLTGRGSLPCRQAGLHTTQANKTHPQGVYFICSEAGISALAWRRSASWRSASLTCPG